eukprot:m51a1_g9631 putative paired amphipathic helix protein sin3b (1103) ;mRNA; f:1136195-1143385
MDCAPDRLADLAGGQTIDTPGVIERVKELFQGHPQLVLGFNTFLPLGYRIEPEAVMIKPSPAEQNPVLQAAHAHGRMLLQHAQPSGAPAAASVSAGAAAVASAGAAAAQVSAPSTPLQVGATGPMPSPATQLLQPPSAGAAQQQQSALRKTPEIEQARNYIKKIKTRFLNQPNVYKHFLEILHSYHKEHQTIKEVYEQVAVLFRDHPDLLDEFKLFLPESPVSQDAHARRQQSAAGGMPRPPKKQRVQAPVPVAPVALPLGPVSPMIGASAAAVAGLQQPQPLMPPHHQAQQGQPRSNKRPFPTRGKDERGMSSPSIGPAGLPAALVLPAGVASSEDTAFFAHLKDTIEPRAYAEFLKCLNLFAQEIVTKAELLNLVRDILAPAGADLFEGFKKFVLQPQGAPQAAAASKEDKSADRSGNNTGEYPGRMENTEKAAKEAAKDSNRNKTGWTDFDVTQCKREGASYRVLPANFVPAKCSGRTELEYSVLSDRFVSVPTGSEDYGGGTGHRMRRSQAEENLLKAEDERYELEIVVEQNNAAACVLQSLIKRYAEVAPEDAANARLDSEDDITIMILERSLTRLYGDRFREVMEQLAQHPAAAAPVVLARLRLKTAELQRTRRDLNKTWRTVGERYYARVTEHQAKTHEAEETRLLAPRAILADARQQRQAAAAEGRPWHLRAVFAEPALHEDIFHLLAFSVGKPQQQRDDADRADTFRDKFLRVLFELDASAASAAASGASGAAGQHCNVLVGTTALFTFLRHYEMLYMRLHKARELSEAANRNAWSATLFSGPSAPWLRAAASVSQSLSPDAEGRREDVQEQQQAQAQGRAAQQQGGGPQASASTAMARYKLFLDTTLSAKAGVLDQSAFEDECATIFGASPSYLLFAVPQLVSMLTRHIKTITEDPTCSKVLALYDYEHARCTSEAAVAAYRDAVRAVTGPADPLFEFRFSAPELLTVMHVAGGPAAASSGAESGGFKVPSAPAKKDDQGSAGARGGARSDAEVVAVELATEPPAERPPRRVFQLRCCNRRRTGRPLVCGHIEFKTNTVARTLHAVKSTEETCYWSGSLAFARARGAAATADPAAQVQRLEALVERLGRTAQ